MKLAIVTCLHKRAEINAKVAQWYADNFPDIKLIAIRSEGDKQILNKKWNYKVFPNNSPSQKHNQSFLLAKQFNPDAVILIGSTDLISKKLVEFYRANYSENANYLLGLKDIYLYDIATGKTKRFPGFAPPYDKFPIGAARIFSKKVLDKLSWRPYGDMHIGKGMDTNSSLFLQQCGIEHRTVTMKEAGECIDLKVAETINPFAKWKGELIEEKIIDRFNISP